MGELLRGATWGFPERTLSLVLSSFATRTGSPSGPSPIFNHTGVRRRKSYPDAMKHKDDRISAKDETMINKTLTAVIYKEDDLYVSECPEATLCLRFFRLSIL